MVVEEEVAVGELIGGGEGESELARPRGEEEVPEVLEEVGGAR